MNWYRNPYFGKTAEKRKDALMRRIEDGAPVPMVYLIALPSGPDNQLEIVSPAVYRKQAERNGETLIVGLASGMSEARQVVCRIAGDVYRLTGSADIRSYFAGMTFDR